jgi:predicted TPR repeat methyltransferase
VLVLEPCHPRANFKCGSALRQLHRESEALVHFGRHLEGYPDSEAAEFWVKVLSGEVVAQAPASHVSSLFDCYAERFEEHLVTSLGYCTPGALVGALEAALADAGVDRGGRLQLQDVLADTGSDKQCHASVTVLQRENEGEHQQGVWGQCVDLGCGTGLLGPLLRSRVSLLEGVDLSQKMVEKAQGKGCYDGLFVRDAVAFLQDQYARGWGFDVMVAADVLVYIGNLAPLLAAAAHAANAGCVFAFSTEQATDAEGMGEAGFRVTSSGRFQHSVEYIKHVAMASGWALLKHQQATLRFNGGHPVMGDLFVLECLA